MIIAKDEYEILHRDAGVVERPGSTIIELEGSEAAEFLQGQVTNDVEALEPGHGCYAALLDHKGKVRTDLRVLRLAPDRLLVLAEPGPRALLLHVFEVYSLGREVRQRDLTEERALLSLIGPTAREHLPEAPPSTEHALVEGALGIAVATDVGVDLVCTAEQAAEARERLGLPLVSEEAAECVRIESGRPRLGFELDGAIPQEADLNDRAVSFTKGCYVGQETVARLFYKGKPNRHLRGLRLSAPAEHGDPVHLGERQVGVIGSACSTPDHGTIALSILRREAAPGDQVTVGESGATAEVVAIPFAS